jgi:hypothetical protein
MGTHHERKQSDPRCQWRDVCHYVFCRDRSTVDEQKNLPWAVPVWIAYRNMRHNLVLLTGQPKESLLGSFLGLTGADVGQLRHQTECALSSADETKCVWDCRNISEVQHLLASDGDYATIAKPG